MGTPWAREVPPCSIAKIPRATGTKRTGVFESLLCLSSASVTIPDILLLQSLLHPGKNLGGLTHFRLLQLLTELRNSRFQVYLQGMC